METGLIKSEFLPKTASRIVYKKRTDFFQFFFLVPIKNKVEIEIIANIRKLIHVFMAAVMSESYVTRKTLMFAKA